MPKKTKDSVHDSMAEELQDTLNKKFKDTGYQAAYFIDTEKDNPANVSDWISTGSDMLDIAISNRPNGGLPVGKIIEITGMEGAGKSLLCAHIVAETQKKGGMAVYIDTEHAVDEQFFTAIGVDMSAMLYVPLSKIEDVFDAADSIIESIRKSNKDRQVTIIVDSIMGAKTAHEEEADHGKDGFATHKAIIMSKAMRKITETIARQKILFICTNQLRTKLGVMFGDPYTTSGGKALAFHASVRLRTKAVGKIKAKIHGIDTVVGMKTQVVVMKNRLGPPHKAINYDIYFDSGIDNVGGWFNILKTYKIIAASGAWCTYTPDCTAEEIKFQSKDFADALMENQEIKAELYAKLIDKFTMKYRPGKDGGVDDVTIIDAYDPNEDDRIADQFDGNVPPEQLFSDVLKSE